MLASIGVYSQSLNLNNNKIRIVDSTMGLGITPTSRLHVFGNGTTSNLLNLVNDKDAVKDSSIVVTSNGSFCSGTNKPYLHTKNTFMIYDKDNTGIVNTTWVDSTTVDSNSANQNDIRSMNTEAYGYFGLGGAKLARSYGDLANSLYMGCYSNSKFHLLNEDYVMMTIDRLGVGIGTTSPNGAFHVKDRWNGEPFMTFIAGNDIDEVYDSSTVIDYFGNVGIGITPTSKLHVFGNGGATDLMKVSNDINSTYDSTFVIKSNGYVGIGNNTTNYPLQVWGSGSAGANIYSEYSGSTTSSAIKGYASGSVGYGIMGIAGTIGAKGGLFENTASGIALDLRADNGIALRIISGDNVVNSIRFHSITTTLSDSSTYALPTGYSWIGEIDVDSLGYSLFTAQIRCDADGTPYLEGVSWKRWSSITYVVVGSTDGYLNITDGGSGMAITNKLGYTINVTLRFRRKQ